MKQIQQEKFSAVRKASAFLLTILLFAVAALPSSANSAQTKWQGIDATGSIIRDDRSPIVVEKERLLFDLSEFPEEYYHDVEQYLAYSGSVTAEYTFYNPSDYTVTATLLFPFGNEPMYAPSYDDETGIIYHNTDTEKFDITVNGEVIEKRLRHTLSSGFSQFQLEEDLALLQDGYTSDPFYALNTTVTKYTFAASGVDTERYKAANAAFDIDPENTERKVYFVGQSGFHTQKDGTIRLGDWVKNGDTFTVYVIGEDFSSFPVWRFYEDGGTEDNEEINGRMTQVVKERLQFKDLALAAWTEETGVSESDWYNAVVALLNDTANSYGGILYLWDSTLDLSSDLMRWYEYEITLEPGQRIVNTVTAPIYPSIDLDYEPSIYGYTYLLSPAKTWASFGELEIVIHTPYYVTESVLGNFTKTDTGYSLTLPGLPDGELEFTLSTSENPKAPVRTVTDRIPVEILISFSVIGGVLLLSVGGVITLLKIRKKKRGENQK